MAFTRWDPIRDLLAIQQQLDRSVRGQAGWAPPVDLHETTTEYVLTAEIPGLTQEEIQVHMRDMHLTIAGARREHTASCERYHRIERGHGSFSRTFQLPHPVDETHITAELRDGVLTVTCPKVPESGARRIDVF